MEWNCENCGSPKKPEGAGPNSRLCKSCITKQLEEEEKISKAIEEYKEEKKVPIDAKGDVERAKKLLVESKMSCNKIAEETGCNSKSVSRWAIELGVKRTKHTSRPKRKVKKRNSVQVMLPQVEIEQPNTYKAEPLPLPHIEEVKPLFSDEELWIIRELRNNPNLLTKIVGLIEGVDKQTPQVHSNEEFNLDLKWNNLSISIKATPEK